MTVPEHDGNVHNGNIGQVPVCKQCGSARVARDAWACFNPDSGLWELEQVFDLAQCHTCEGETKLVWTRPAELLPDKRVQKLNDAFRMAGLGKGHLVVTRGVIDLGEDHLQPIVDRVRSFDSFSKDNDPWGEHDFGAFEYDGQKIFWKIDCYAPDLQSGSPNPGNAGETIRVLTIMLASEY